MPATLEKEGDLRVVRVCGTLRKSELDAIQWEEAKNLPAGVSISVLVIADGFEGWSPDDEWGDVRFVAYYGDRIGKIALVGDPAWEDRLLMFAGAGVRRTQVKFFPKEKMAEGRAWLAD